MRRDDSDWVGLGKLPHPEAAVGSSCDQASVVALDAAELGYFCMKCEARLRVLRLLFEVQVPDGYDSA